MKTRIILLCLTIFVSVAWSTVSAQFVFKNNTQSEEYLAAVDKMTDEIFARWAEANSDLPDAVIADVANNAKPITIPHYVGVCNMPKEQTITLKLSQDCFCDIILKYKDVTIGESVLYDRKKFMTIAYRTADLGNPKSKPEEAADSAHVIKKFAMEHNAFSVYGISLDNVLFFEKDGKYYKYNMDNLQISPFDINEARNNKLPASENEDGSVRPVGVVSSALGGAACLFVLLLTIM